MIQREMAKIAKQRAREFPVLTITGPRQSGKTTLARACFPEYGYVNLEDPETRELAENDRMDLANAWFDGLEPRLEGRQELFYRCDCSRDRMEKALAALGREELEDILRTDGYATLTCHFCRTARVFDENDLKRLLGKEPADA